MFVVIMAVLMALFVGCASPRKEHTRTLQGMAYGHEENLTALKYTAEERVEAQKLGFSVPTNAPAPLPPSSYGYGNGYGNGAVRTSSGKLFGIIPYRSTSWSAHYVAPPMYTAPMEVYYSYPSYSAGFEWRSGRLERHRTWGPQPRRR